MSFQQDDAREEPVLPKMVPGRQGTRLYSIAALIELVIEQFHAEHGDLTSLRDADAGNTRLRLLLEAANYVIAVESVDVSQDEKVEILRRAYSEIFGYGPLDALFADERVTTISLLGASHASVRYGHGELVSLGAIFDDSAHLKQVISRLLEDAGAQLRDDSVIIETGLLVGDRPVSVSVAAPPVTIALNADIRIHPSQPVMLADLIDDGFMSAQAADTIISIVRSKYGFCIVGEPESGKTTLLNAVAPLLPAPYETVAVERAGELRLPTGMRRLRARWPVDDAPEISFGLQIEAALLERPTCLLLDEVRADEPLTIAPLLDVAEPPRQIWSVRGVPDAKRLQSAMGMMARRAALGQGEAFVHALYERLPFVITVARIRERLQLFSIAEWQSRVDTDYPDFVMIYQYRDGASRPTDSPFARWLE